jgi:hypothetical protein
MKLNSLPKVCFAAVSMTVCAAAAPGTIGVATAVGTFDINQVRVEGNANVADGSQVRTGNAASQVLLQSGPALSLGVNSSGQVYRDHLVLQEGATKIDNMDRFSVQADKYLIRGAQPNSRAMIKMDTGEVQIAALGGSLDVLNDRGLLLTRIGAGTASAFNRGGGQNGSSRPASDTANRPREAALYLLLLASMAGLGLAIDAILQPGNPTPTSP